MPPTRHIGNEHPLPASPFHFPTDNHLLITTPSYIFAWDSAGIHTIFKSSKSGIVAARGAKDGSGILAVADKHVVVLHDTKRGQEQSCGLRADEDEVRQLEYAQDARWLYLSTSLTHDVQRYSLERSRLMSPAQTHNNAPVAMAVSPTGHLIVSASDDPPVVYLKSLQHNSPSTLIEPRASDSTVCSAAFHQERPNIFMLGFRDGTLAAYDATRVSRRTQGSFSNQETVNDGEIAHFTGLHRTTSKTVSSGGSSSRAASIAGCAFIHGYKSRAISIGSDGRCRLVDFADGGIVLRSWHAKAPLTSVSVLSIRSHSDKNSTMRRSSKPDAFTLGGPTSTNNLIAVSRTDGKIQIYDAVGIMLEHKVVSPPGEKVISVEWVKGPSPRPIASAPTVKEMSDAPNVPWPQAELIESLQARIALTPPQPKADERRQSTPKGGIGLPPGLRRTLTSAEKRTSRSNRRFTIHPDELEQGTVKYTPSDQKSKPVVVQGDDYLDLFSPVKQSAPQKAPQPEKRPTASPRPRLSSHTFSIPVENGQQPQQMTVESTVTSTPSEAAAVPKPKPITTGHVRKASTHVSPLNKRHISFKPNVRPGTQSGSFQQGPVVPPNENAKVLADLRKMTQTASGLPQKSSVLAPFAGSKTNTPQPDPPHQQPPQVSSETHPHPITVQQQHATKRRRWSRKHTHHKPREGPAHQKEWHPGNVLEREATWPTDSMIEESLDEHNETDIWITDEEEREADELQRRRMAPFLQQKQQQEQQRPLAAALPRSQQLPSTAVSPEAVHMARTSTHPMSPKTRAVTGNLSPRTRSSMQVRQHLDGSTTDDWFGTAREQLSPSEHAMQVTSQDVDPFKPSSADIRELFPRASSLSPHRSRSPKRSLAPRRVLQEVSHNAVARQASRDPWVKAKAAASHPSKAGQIPCFTCSETGTRVVALEDEVARLKGEVLALKAALRRNGVTAPTSVRGRRPGMVK